MKRIFQCSAAAGILSAGLLVLAGSVRAVTTNVTYGDYYFSPQVVTINAGDTVNWVPAGSDQHTLLGTGSDPICGGINLPCSYTFNTPGSYPYECTLHFFAPLNMTGMVVVLSLPSLPSITTQPQDQTVLTNSMVTFSVTASNAATYQWQSNLVNIPGATNSSLVLSNVVTGDSASYRVIVSNLAGSVTSSNATLLVLTENLPFIVTPPESQMALTNSTVTFSVTASNAESYQWESNLVDLQGETNDSFTLTNVVIDDSANYQVVVSNVSGSVTSAIATLLVGFPPRITQQPSGTNVSAGTPVTFHVAATGSPPSGYQWLMNGAAIPGQTNADLFFGAALAKNQGAYSVLVSNAFGAQMSSNAVLTVTPLTSVLKENLSVTVNPPGSGTVIPNLDGKSLIATHSYTVTAIPAKGRAFAGWSGIAESPDRALAFVMPSLTNATLAANFIPSPFASNGVAGAYTGLFWDTNNLSNEASGYFSAVVGASGIIDGQVKIAGAPTPFVTTLHADGSGSVTLKRRNQNSLILTLQVDLTGLEALTGTVADSANTFNAPLLAYRAGFSASQKAVSYEGYYTWAMTGPGYSFGSAKIAPDGTSRLKLSLSDGVTATASGLISSNGQMALYVSLYRGEGSLLSWLTFTNSTAALSTNAALWFHDHDFSLTNLSLWLGAYPTTVTGTNAFGAGSVSVQFSGGNLVNSPAKTVALDPNGIGGSFSNLSLTVSSTPGIYPGLGAGMFTGSYKDPASGKTIRFNGAVLHPTETGYGFFNTGNSPGPVVIQPQ